EAELERLCQVVVEDLALVVDDDALVAFAQFLDDLSLFFHLSRAPEDTEVLVHRLRELVADLPRAPAVGAVEQLLQIAFRVCLRRPGHLDNRVCEGPVRRVATGALAEGDRLHQRVAAEPVRAVDRYARTLSRRVEPLHARSSPDVRIDAA